MKLTTTTKLGEIFIPNMELIGNFSTIFDTFKQSDLMDFIANVTGNMETEFIFDYFQRVFEKPIDYNFYISLKCFTETDFTEQEIKDFYKSSDFTTICLYEWAVVKLRYYTKWSKMFNALNKEYDILSPYSINKNKTENETLTSHNSDTGTSTTTDNSTDSSWGYNTNESPKPTDKTVNESSRERNLATDYNRSTDFTNTEKISGNIGNHTNQDIIKQEYELRRIELINNIIYPDMDTVFTRHYYGGF